MANHRWEMTAEEKREAFGDNIIDVIEAMLADKAVEVKEGDRDYHKWHDSNWFGRGGLEEVLECYYHENYKYRVKK